MPVHFSKEKKLTLWSGNIISCLLLMLVLYYFDLFNDNGSDCIYGEMNATYISV